MIVWSRPSCAPPGTPFCAVHLVDASVHTFCRGRWVPSDGDQIRWSAPAEERCGGCSLGLIGIRCDEVAAELDRARGLDGFCPIEGEVEEPDADETPPDDFEIEITPGDQDEPAAFAHLQEDAAP